MLLRNCSLILFVYMPLAYENFGINLSFKLSFSSLPVLHYCAYDYNNSYLFVYAIMMLMIVMMVSVHKYSMNSTGGNDDWWLCWC